MATEPKVSCKEVIQKCDKALADKNKELELADLAIQRCNEVNGHLKHELEDTKDERDAWYRNPLVMGLFGVIVGGVAVGVLNK